MAGISGGLMKRATRLSHFALHLGVGRWRNGERTNEEEDFVLAYRCSLDAQCSPC